MYPYATPDMTTKRIEAVNRRNVENVTKILQLPILVTFFQAIFIKKMAMIIINKKIKCFFMM